MKDFNYAKQIKVGSIFSRTDKNGKKWIAEVTYRTEYFVKVKIHSPYPHKVADEHNLLGYVEINNYAFEEGKVQINPTIKEIKGKPTLNLLGIESCKTYYKIVGYNIVLHDRKNENWTSEYVLENFIDDEENIVYDCNNKNFNMEEI